jgi:transcriptional regulator GlxA family with amidase domain
MVETGYVIDGARLTASSGAAALDMMLEVVAARHGKGLGSRVSARLKPGAAPPAIPTLSRPRIQHPKLLAVISRMETHIEDPVSIEGLADLVDLSKRQLERLFQRHLGQSPAKYYMAQRLARAQLLLAQTAMPIVEVAQASGFVAVSHFSKSYREHFGHTPRMERVPSFRRNGRNGSGTRVIA